MPEQVLLDVRGLTKRYNGVPVVDHVSFTVSRGEVLGYLGPNGAGKSTTVKMLIGMVRPTEGEILFEGRKVKDDITGFQRRLGYVPEEAHVYPQLSGFEYLELAARLRGLRRAVLEPKIEEFLQVLSLWEDRHSPLGSYSKGMRQKILLAAALLHDPDVLILDEPFSGLDVGTALVLRSVLLALAAGGKAVLYSSHVLEVVEKICTNVLILSKGRVVAYNSVARLREMMGEPSLERVFTQLTSDEDTEAAAGKIIQIMRA